MRKRKRKKRQRRKRQQKKRKRKKRQRRKRQQQGKNADEKAAAGEQADGKSAGTYKDNFEVGQRRCCGFCRADSEGGGREGLGGSGGFDCIPRVCRPARCGRCGDAGGLSRAGEPMRYLRRSWWTRFLRQIQRTLLPVWPALCFPMEVRPILSLACGDGQLAVTGINY